jgi:formaldehyde dismutase / methanol dehydrogenase
MPGNASGAAPGRFLARAAMCESVRSRRPGVPRRGEVHVDIGKVYEVPIREHWRQPRALLGPGAVEAAGPEAAAMGLKHVLIVTSGLRGTGIVDEVQTNFENAGVSVTVYDKVESNPKDYNVMDAYQAFSEAQCDGFVSLGGGSSHDTAKGARIVAAHDGRNVNDFAGLNVSERLDNPPQIAINTTVGTGSETTPAYVITDTTSDNAPYKWVGFDKACTTTLAINDPVLMLTQPAEFVAYTGFDTMAHASECYVNRIQMHSATPQSLKAVQLVEDNLRQAYANPRDIDAMTNMMWAQYMAAQAFSSGLLGIIHSLSHAVCAWYDVHHGLNNGVGIARVWTYNLPACPDRFADIADAMHATKPGMSTIEKADAAVEAVIRLARDCGIPENWSSAQEYPKTRVGQGWYESRPTKIEPDDDELQKMAVHMYNDLCTPANPRQVTVETCKEILRDCAFDAMDSKVGQPMNGRPGHGGVGATTPRVGTTELPPGAVVVEA